MIAEITLNREILRREAKGSFYSFVRYAWPIIEPKTTYVDGWHIQVVCDHLQKVASFDIEKLIVNIPPRHMKSIIACVMFPAWVWGERPHLSFIYGSHSQALATRDSIKTRELITSMEYKAVFDQEWTLADDQNAKTDFKNTEGGARKSVGVGTGLVGFGGDFLFCDDPLNPLGAHSEVARNSANNWVDYLGTRMNNPNKYARVTVMQRVHANDPSGHLLEKDPSFQRLILPAEYDSEAELKSKTILRFKDPRREKGELLWPNQWTKKSIDDMKLTLGDDANAQLNQDPKTSGGGFFPPEYWKRFSTPPSPILETATFVDCAQKPGVSNDWSVWATWARTTDGYFLIGLSREKTDFPLLEAITINVFNTLKPNAVVIEDKSAGSSLIQNLRTHTTIPIFAYDPGQRDKTVRASAAKPMVKSGRCFIPDYPIMGTDEKGKEINLIEEFVKEHEKFLKTKHDDMVDTTSMMYEHFLKRDVTGPRVRGL